MLEHVAAAEDFEAADVDAADAESLYRTLEEQVVPLYYDREDGALPRKWITMMKNSIATLIPEFNSNRMVDEYARGIYKNGGV